VLICRLFTPHCNRGLIQLTIQPVRVLRKHSEASLASSKPSGCSRSCRASGSLRLPAIVHVDAATSPASPPRIATDLQENTVAHVCLHTCRHGKRRQYSALPSVDASDTGCGPVAPKRGCSLLSGASKGIPPRPAYEVGHPLRNRVPWRHSPPLPPPQFSAEEQLPSTNHKRPTSGLGNGHKGDA
jgi:hypothetical protein